MISCLLGQYNGIEVSYWQALLGYTYICNRHCGLDDMMRNAHSALVSFNACRGVHISKSWMTDDLSRNTALFGGGGGGGGAVRLSVYQLSLGDTTISVSLDF